MLYSPPFRICLTLLLALAGASLCVWLRTPLPWMVGPLLVTALASMRGVPTQSSNLLRNTGQWTIATAVGLYFTPQIAVLVAGLWWAIALGIMWGLAMGWLFGSWLYYAHGHRIAGTPQEQRATTYFAAAIGGASEMTLLAERECGRSDLVAASHSLRILLVTLLVPFALGIAGLHASAALPAGFRVVHWGGLLLLGAATGAGGWLMRRTGNANPWFMGPLIVSMALTLAGVELSAVPQWLTNSAQVVMAISLGVRFEARFVRTAPRWLGCVMVGTVGMIVLSAGFGAVLAFATGLHPATMVLGTSPGGIAEMAITAKVLGLGAPVVTAFQVCRLATVLVLVEPLYRWLYPKVSG